jgi:hypothetical protein
MLKYRPLMSKDVVFMKILMVLAENMTKQSKDGRLSTHKRRTNWKQTKDLLK